MVTNALCVAMLFGLPVPKFSPMQKSRESTLHPIFVALACLAPLIGFWNYGLFDLDEGYYGAVVADMLRRGDWITPTLNGTPWFEKPILSYWLAMPSVTLFGPEFGPRLPSVICTLLTSWVAYRFGRRYFGNSAGLLAAAFYSGSLLVVGLGRMMMTDAPFNLFLVLAFTTFYDSLLGDQRRRLWTALFLGLAVLAKGPVALVLFLGVAVATLWRMPQLRAHTKKYWVTGTLLLSGVIAIWYWPCYRSNGQVFLQKFLIEQNIGRFAGGDKAHAVPLLLHPIYYPIVLTLALLPALFWCGRGVWKRPLLLNTDEGNARTYLVIWTFTVLIFFSISGSKLPHYILPAIFPGTLAIVVTAMGHRGSDHVKKLILPACLWCVAIWPVAQTTFQSIYAAQFAEVQGLARALKNKPGTVVSYAMGRRNQDVSISLDLQETSHPSLSFYAGRSILETDKTDSMGTLPLPIFVITRAGRVDFAEKALLLSYNRFFEPVPTDVPQNEYRLFEIKQLTASR